MQKMKSRGMGNVIGIILMIMISLALIFIIAFFVFNAIKPSLSPGFSCLDAQVSKPIEIKKACYNVTSKILQVKVARKIIDMDIKSMDFVIDSDKDSSSWSCTFGCGSCILLDMGDTKTYYFDSKGNSVQLAISNCLLDKKDVVEC